MRHLLLVVLAVAWGASLAMSPLAIDAYGGASDAHGLPRDARPVDDRRFAIRTYQVPKGPEFSIRTFAPPSDRGFAIRTLRPNRPSLGVARDRLALPWLRTEAMPLAPGLKPRFD